MIITLSIAPHLCTKMTADHSANLIDCAPDHPLSIEL